MCARPAKPNRGAPKRDATSAPRTAKAPPPTVLVVTPPGWNATTQSGAGGARPVSVPLDQLQALATPVKPAKPAKAARKKSKPSSRGKPAPAHRPRWTLLVWIAAATCVVLAALQIGHPDGGVLGYLVAAGVLMLVAMHRVIGSVLRRALGPPPGSAKPKAKLRKRKR